MIRSWFLSAWKGTRRGEIRSLDPGYKNSFLRAPLPPLPEAANFEELSIENTHIYSILNSDGKYSNYNQEQLQVVSIMQSLPFFSSGFSFRPLLKVESNYDLVFLMHNQILQKHS